MSIYSIFTRLLILQIEIDKSNNNKKKRFCNCSCNNFFILDLIESNRIENYKFLYNSSILTTRQTPIKNAAIERNNLDEENIIKN